MSKVQVHVGGLIDMGRSFVDAWHRVETGATVHETNVTFLDLAAIQAALSPRRIGLLRHVSRHGATSTRSLAEALARDYKNVHAEVAAVEVAGLLVREGRKLAAPRDEVQASVMLV